MALSGTLEDISIVDLIQYPYTGKRTGEMVIVGPEHEARLYYDEGSLTHSQYNGAVGLEALIAVLDWKHGDFEFRTGVQPEQTTIEGDLHHVVMKALKARDEQRQQQDREREEAEENARLKAQYGDSASTDPVLFKRLLEFIRGNEQVVYCAILEQDGSLVAQVGQRGKLPDEATALCECLTALADAYPRQTFSRLCIEDDDGAVVMSDIGRRRRMVAVAKEGTPLGAVSRAIAKFGSAGASR
jgi:predicted regulator of Ras-like GTPase activity (Roadblock/LC7/MglB family)